MAGRKVVQRYVVEDKASNVVSSATGKISRSLKSVETQTAITTSKMSTSVGKFGKAGNAVASGLGASFAAMNPVLLGIAAAVGAMTLAFKGFKASVNVAADFEAGMANVSTLVDTTTVSMEKLRKELLSLPNAFGSPIANTKALYQAISAGIEPAKAVAFLGEASKAALAGLTDTETAVNTVTSVLNAYGMAATDITKINDQMFTAIKLGKTTFEEISKSIGQVAPVAASLKIPTEELFSALTTLTKQGIDTSRAVTGLKAAFSNVLKPSSQAGKLAEELGLQFDAAALSSKGLAKFLEDIQTATGGNQEQMAKLFGSVEALNSVLALTSETGAKSLKEALNAMKNSAGETDKAFEKNRDTFKMAKEEIGTALERIGIVVGEKILPPLKKMVIAFANFISQKETLQVMEGIITLIGKSFEFIGISIKIVVDALKLYFDYVKSIIEIGKVFYEVLTGQKTAIDGLKDSLKIIVDFLKEFVSYIKESTTAITDWLNITDKVVDIADKVKGKLSGAVGSVKQAAESAAGGITKEKKNAGKVIIEFFGKGSTIKPISEKIEEIIRWMGGLTTKIKDMNPNLIVDIKDQEGKSISKSIDIVDNKFGNFFDNLIDGTMSVDGAFKNMTVGILGSLSNMLRDQAVREFKGLLGIEGSGSLFGSIASLFGGGMNTGVPIHIGAGGTTAFGMANGGIVPGGLTPMAGGGVVKSATAALVGEKGQNEAVVPLPDGRNIPVNMQGSSGAINNFYIQAVDSESFFNIVQKNPEAIVAAFSGQIDIGNQSLTSSVNKATRLR